MTLASILFLTIYIALFVGIAIGAVGGTYTIKYGWDLPLKLFGTLIFPAILGYLIGKGEK